MSSTLAKSPAGSFQGRDKGRVIEWLGIRYGKPPIGVLRFAEPQPSEAQSGVTSALAFGAPPIQRILPLLGSKMLGGTPSEDCLFLNVWSPSPDQAKRPVLVWIHGGMFTGGSAATYVGANLSRDGDIVVVTINYRLGVFGFSNFVDTTGDKTFATNAGLRDQILALEWVRDNIEAFGGDPGRVTIAGESVGGCSVMLLLSSNQAKPLFHQAIAQSGSVTMISDRATSREIAEAYIEAAEASDNPDKLRATSATDLLKLQSSIEKRFPNVIPTGPWFDGDLLPSTFSAVASNTATVPLIVGYNRDEIPAFARPPSFSPIGREVIGELMRRQLEPKKAEAILESYPVTKRGSQRLTNDLNFTVPAIHAAERQATKAPVWLYRFDFTHPILGAAHGLDLFFLWEIGGVMGFIMRAGRMRGARLALAKRMQAACITFVRHGRPSPDWPQYDTTRSTMIFDFSSSVQSDPENTRRVLWEGVDILVGADRSALNLL